MRNLDEIKGKVAALRSKHADRDGAMERIAAVRRGDMTMFGDLFPADWPKPIVANFVDIAARDIAEVLAPLPTFSCTGGRTLIDDRARSRAEKKTQIVYGYIADSRLETQMFNGADQFITYGFLPVRVEPDFDSNRPRILVEDPVGGYPEFDRWGDTVSYTKVWKKSELELCALFPDLAPQIRRDNWRSASDQAQLEVIKYHDADGTVMYLPERQNLVLARQDNPLGRCLVKVALRPNLEAGKITGQFDDVLWVQLARAKFALLALEAAQKSVQAPYAVPNDVQDFAIGPDAILRSANPEKIGRVAMDVPREAFVTSQLLEQEQRLGSRYPESRTGNMDASVITGRGVQALSSGFDSQIKAAQQIFADTFAGVVEIALELDEKLWPDQRKTVTGVRNGTPYEITYRPSVDIKGDYKVDVTYGLMAGLDPNRALVFVLQGLGADLFSKNFARRNLPASMNVVEEEQMIDIEKLRDSTMQAVAGYVQALPVMEQTAPGSAAEAVRRIAAVVKARKAGDPIEDAVSAAFAPPPPPEDEPPGSEEPVEDEGSPGQMAPGGGQGLAPSGLMTGVAPGQAGRPPGGRPDLNYLLASLGSTGKPNLSVGVVRRQPA